MNKWQITITASELWIVFKWSGLVLFALSLVALFTGDLPDNGGWRFGNILRWIFWPLFALWLLGALIKGFFF